MKQASSKENPKPGCRTNRLTQKHNPIKINLNQLLRENTQPYKKSMAETPMSMVFTPYGGERNLLLKPLPTNS